MDFTHKKYADLYIQDGVLFFISRPIPCFDLSVAQKSIIDRLQLQREQSFPILCDIRQMSFANLEARKYLALEGLILVDAIAFLVSPNINQRFIRFFIEVDLPAIPTAIFTSREEALQFLAPFKT